MATADAEALPAGQQQEQHDHTHENGEICEQHRELPGFQQTLYFLLTFLSSRYTIIEHHDTSVRSELVFDLTILVPKASFGSQASSSGATKFDRDDIDCYVALFLPSSGADILRDIRQTVADSPEGFWLGVHSFDRVKLQEIPAEKEGNEPTLAIVPGESSQVFSDSVDLAKVFEGDEYSDHEVRRALRVVPGRWFFPSDYRSGSVAELTSPCTVPYTDLEARSHVLRLRDTILGFNVALQGRQAYSPAPADPNALAIGAGHALYPILRGPLAGENGETQDLQEAALPNGHDEVHINGTSSSKKGKGKGKAKPASAPPQAVLQAVSAKRKEPDTSSSWLFDSKDAMSIIAERSPQRPMSKAPFKTLQFSVWNPPPPHYRMKGHLIYLAVTTSEGEAIQITGAEQGFFINRSDNHHFDPLPKPASKNNANASQVYQSLYDLLSSVSKHFAVHRQQIVSDILPQAYDFHAGTAVTHCPAAAPWLISPPNASADAARSQIPYALTGSTNLETLPVARDWNEEQTAMRELPKVTNDDKLVRDRFGSRLLAEFQSAAARGIQCVVRGDVPALNALDTPDARSYLFHNILFTQALDSMDMMKHLGGNEAVRVSSSKDLQAMSLLANADLQGVHTICTAVIDYAGERWVAQSIPPGIFNRPAPEEAKPAEDGSVAQPTVVQPGLRSVYGPKDTEKPLEGYVADPTFAKLAEKVAQRFHLAKHTVADKYGKETELWLPADVHGVAAADGRSYVIDLCELTRSTNVRSFR